MTIRVTCARTAHAVRRDDGVAIVEFVMVGVLLVFLLFGVLQLAAVFYVRNVVAASAADGARYAAAEGVGVGDGAVRANQLIAQALSPSMSRAIRCASSVTVDAASGLAVERVQCRGRINSIFLPVGAFVAVDVVAHALREQP
jgi:Flp pilus assembly protein TadG